MQAWLVKIALQYGSKLLIAALALAVVTATYFSWKHDIQKAEHDRVVAEFEKRDAETERKGQEFLKLREHEIGLDTKKKDKQYIGAIESYANYSIDLHRQLDANRMQHKPAKTSCGGNRVQERTEDSGALARTGPETIQELEYLESMKAVELIIETICVPNARVE